MGILHLRLKQKRQESGLTLALVAVKLEQTEATTQRHESGGIKNIPYEKICAYADLYKTTPEYLMGWDKEASVLPRDDFSVDTIAAHHDGDEWTEEELEEIERFKAYVRSKRSDQEQSD